MYFVEVDASVADERVRRDAARAVAALPQTFPREWAALGGVALRWIRGYRLKSEVDDSCRVKNDTDEDGRQMGGLALGGKPILWDFRGYKGIMGFVDRHHPATIFLRADAAGYTHFGREYPVEDTVFHEFAHLLQYGYGWPLDEWEADAMATEIWLAADRGMTYAEFARSQAAEDDREQAE